MRKAFYTILCNIEKPQLFSEKLCLRGKGASVLLRLREQLWRPFFPASKHNHLSRTWRRTFWLDIYGLCYINFSVCCLQFQLLLPPGMRLQWEWSLLSKRTLKPLILNQVQPVFRNGGWNGEAGRSNSGGSNRFQMHFVNQWCHADAVMCLGENKACSAGESRADLGS